MTGEITLRGRVLPVGGVREKVLAAHRAGLRTIIMPERNVKDLIDVPKKVRDDLKIVPVTHMDEVLTVALYSATEKPPRAKRMTAKEKHEAENVEGAETPRPQD